MILNLVNFSLTDSFEQSSYTSRVANVITFLFIELYTPGFFVMSIAVTAMDVARCYFHDGLSDVKCLLTPYRYV